jgi:hypothetical protein
MLFCPSPNFGWFFATHQQHNMYGGNFTKILMVTSFFSVSLEYSKKAMVSTQNKIDEVDMEPISDYYEKHL